jgi:hypothetical protein
MRQISTNSKGREKRERQTSATCGLSIIYKYPYMVLDRFSGLVVLYNYIHIYIYIKHYYITTIIYIYMYIHTL